MLAEENDVIIENVGNKCVITLNRPRALNAFNPSVCRKIQDTMKKLKSSEKSVIIRSSGGKAFCAGGDLKLLFSLMSEENSYKVIQDSSRLSYTLFHLIGSYEKPYIAIINGITIGEGAGLSVVGKYRIATENTVFAMPETEIGLYPDGGATYFLPRLKGKLGLFLGLTGYKLKGIDVYLAGIATHYISSNQIADLTDKLLALEDEDVDTILYKYQPEASKCEFGLEPHMERVNRCFSASTVEGIIENLEAENSGWTDSLVRSLRKMSPTSLKVTKKALEIGAGQSLSECLKMEFRLSCTFLNKESDLYEGIRALLIDRDQKPKWNPKTLSGVTDEYINQKFASLPNDLDLGMTIPSSKL